MTIEQAIAEEIARVHVEIDAASDAYRQRLHDAVRSWANVHTQNTDLQAVVNRQRGEIEILKNECEQHRLYIDQLEAKRKDALAANRTYGRLLTDVRGALGALDDADLVEVARSLTAENEGRRTALEQIDVAAAVVNNTRAVLNRVDSALDEIVGLETEPTVLGSQAARVVARLERAESECERLGSGIALARAYKAAVDGLNGAAGAEAALFAWLEEVDHV